MSILIKGLKMPEDGALLCLKIYPSGVVRTCFSPPQPPDSKIATAIPISYHGDLIERDELIKHEVYIPLDGGNLPVVYTSYVKAAKTVIPAERSEE